MNTYSSYKESEVEWIGEIPSGWDMVRLKFVGKVIIGLSYKPDHIVEKHNGTLVMRSSNVQNGKPSFLDNVYVNTEIPKKLRTMEGDILICSRNGSRKLIGKNCVITKDIEGMTFGVFMTVFRSQYWKFVYWVLNSPIFKNQSGLYLTSTINQLTVSTLESFVIPFTQDPREQQQISNYLDHKTQQIDSLIEKTQQKIDLLKEQRTSLINQVVTKGLNPDVEMKNSGVEWIGEIPSGWGVQPLKYFTDVTLGKMLTPEDKGGYLLKPYLRSQNVQNERTDVVDVKEMWFSERELPLYRLKKGDLLVNEGGDVGRTSMWEEELEEVYIQNSINRVSVLVGMNRYYLYHFVLNHTIGYFDSVVNRVSIPHLTKEKLMNVSFLCPPIQEQQQIIDHLDKGTTKIDSTIEKETQRIDLLKEYRQSLISEVVTGKVDIRDEELV